MRIVHLLGLSLWLVFACKSSLPLPGQAKGPQIRFGSGGGITGAVTTYTLLEKGHLYRHTSRPDSLTYLWQVPRAERKAFFARIEDLDLATKPLMQPGNLYYFLEYRTETDSARSVWGAPGAQVPEEILSLYKDLTAKVNPEM
ncbi:MAG: hypothetical protein D6722_07580 [Bacteroidetes bacterium]|nr:MAG: hypothetical protein D6722_07580 [Bacteroidota bacterium]